MADDFDEFADIVVANAQESYVRELTDRLTGMLAKAVDNPDRYEVLVRQAPAELMGVWAKWSQKVPAAAGKAFRSAMMAQDEGIVETLRRGFHGYLGGVSAYAENRINEAARGVAEIVRRQNVALANTAAVKYYEAVGDAVTRIQMGESRAAVMERGVKALADAGIRTVDYVSGVSSQIDVAIRRHMVTQWNQCRNDLLMHRCDQANCDLVMVSAHFGARPTHAVWQGGVYSRSGTDSKYPSLTLATGYGSVTGLCGANCKHTMTPYIEGFSKKPSTDFSKEEEAAGMSSDAYYEETQRQRAIERRIRAVKREIAAGQAEGLDMTASRLRLGRLQSLSAKHAADTHVPRDYSRERAYGVKEQPRPLRVRQKPESKTSVRMSEVTEEKSRWPKHTKPISRKDYVRIRDMAKSSGITVLSLNNAGLDAGAAEMMVLRACEVVERYPELRVVDGKPLKLDFGDLAAGDYGCIYPDDWSTVHISRTILRDKEVLERNYSEDAAGNEFVNAGSADAVVVHELGHVLCHVRGIDCVAVVNEAIVGSQKEKLSILGRDVSKCASSDGTMLEALAESFVAEYYGVGNETTKSIVRRAFS